MNCFGPVSDSFHNALKGLELPADCRSYLENALLSGNEAIITYALSVDKAYYDSGALCAAVQFNIQSSPSTELAALCELLRRRNHTSDQTRVNPFLENVAVSLAAIIRRIDIVTLLLQVDERSVSACFTQGVSIFG